VTRARPAAKAAKTEAAERPADERRTELVRRLASWFLKNRRDLPWRRTGDPYAIWVSEIMLQQTRVKTVLDYYPRFVRAYPTVEKLAKADLAEVLGAWSGLGYYRRARALHAGAREVVECYGGKLPSDAASLRAISGIGPYTAGAIASLAFGAREALVDGNVARVFARIFAMTCDVRSPAGTRQMWELARELVPEAEPGRFNEAVMELGATVCLPGEPRCEKCPVRDLCEARARGLEKDLPVAKKKKDPKKVDLVAVVSRRGTRVLLGRRKIGGLFGGLWEPPMVEVLDPSRPEASLESVIGERLRDLRVVGEQTHVLTHRKFRITIATAAMSGDPVVRGGTPYESFEWCDASQLAQRGMSSLARKILLACPEST
jgi:A/G-specific adenine glycosylase